MPVTVCVLGSGSSGNCTYVATERTRILIDAGFSRKETIRRLVEIGVDVADLDGICVSHEHNDHTAGIRILHQHHDVPLYANSGTVEAIRRNPKMAEVNFNVFSTGSPFVIGDLEVEPFSVPHDAYEPVGFVVRAEDRRVGIATDLGMATTLIRERLRPCEVVIVESNHDEDLVADAERPWHLKQRILGRQGHLSNLGAAAVVRDIAGPHLNAIYLAHLSEDCNREELALQTLESTLAEAGHTHVKVHLTYADRISEMVCLN